MSNKTKWTAICCVCLCGSIVNSFTMYDIVERERKRMLKELEDKKGGEKLTFIEKLPATVKADLLFTLSFAPTVLLSELVNVAFTMDSTEDK